MSSALAIVEKAGNLTIAEEDALRSRLAEMEEALEKEQSNERAIEDKIKVCEVCAWIYSSRNTCVYSCSFGGEMKNSIRTHVANGCVNTPISPRQQLRSKLDRRNNPTLIAVWVPSSHSHQYSAYIPCSARLISPKPRVEIEAHGDTRTLTKTVVRGGVRGA